MAVEVSTLETRIQGADQFKRGMDGITRSTERASKAAGAFTERLRDARGRFMSAKSASEILTQQLKKNASASQILERSLSGAHGELKRASSGLGGLQAALGPVSKAVGTAVAIITAATVALYSFGAAAVEVGARFERLQTSLVTVTGSAGQARLAFGELQQLALDTPMGVEGLTRAFIRLRAQGLDATRESIVAYGDLASAFEGKTVVDFVEAVADATQGQGRRLKEFGIGMKKAGGEVTFAFGDMTKTVKNSAAEIEDALRDLAQERFGGAMERQADTLSGRFAKLSDAWDQFLAKVMEGGLDDALRDAVDWLTEFFEKNDEMARTIGSMLAGLVNMIMVAIKTALTGIKMIMDLTGASTVFMAQEIMRVSNGTVQLKKELSNMDTSNPQVLADKLKLVREEIDKARESLVGAGDATGVWLLRIAMLERIAGQTVGAASESIDASLIGTITGIRDAREAKATADLRTELEKALADLDRIEKEAAALLGEKAEIETGIRPSTKAEEALAKARAKSDRAMEGAFGQKYDLSGSSEILDIMKPKARALKEDELVDYAEKAAALAKQAEIANQKVSELKQALATEKAEDARDLGEKQAEKLASALAGLEMAADTAKGKLSIALSGEDLRAMEIETKLLEFKNGLKAEGIDISKKGYEEEVKRARVAIEATYDANKALKEQKDLREKAAKEAKARADFFEDLKGDTVFETKKQGLVAGGLDAKELEIQIELLKRQRELKITDPTELAKLDEEVRKLHAIRDATDALTRSREQATSVQSGLDTEILGASARLRFMGAGLSEKELAVELKLLDIRLQNKALTDAQVEGYRDEVSAIVELEAQTAKLANSHAALKGFVKANEDIWGNLEQAGVSAIDRLIDKWAEFMSTGKLDLKDFVKTALLEINKIILKWIVAEGLKAAFKDEGGVSGGGGSAGSQLLGLAGDAVGALIKHDGGLVGDSGPTRLVSSGLFGRGTAQILHRGGIAGRRLPGLRPDEVPAILQRGEVVIPRDRARIGGERRSQSSRQRPIFAPNINFQVFSPNADSFRESQRKIEMDLARALDLAARQHRGEG